VCARRGPVCMRRIGETVGSEQRRRRTHPKEARRAKAYTHPDHRHRSLHIQKGLCAHTHVAFTTQNTLSFPPSSPPQTTQRSLFICVLLDLLGYKQIWIFIKSWNGADTHPASPPSAGGLWRHALCLRKGLLFVKNLLVCGQAGTSPCPKTWEY
jgi:hypothetical protein